MAMVTMMMAMATKDHMPQSQDTKQTQHFVFLHLVVQYVPVIRYMYSIIECGLKKQNQKRKICTAILLFRFAFPGWNEKDWPPVPSNI